MMDKRPLIVLTGPTAAGKTELSLRVAERYGCEIISADSMQVYKYMDIGSAKIGADEMRGIRHHLIDVLMPEEEFSVYRFVQMAKQAIDEIYGRGKIPLVVGGTGFYIRALLYDAEFTEESADNELRARLEALAEEIGPEALHERLIEVDPESAKIIHPNNVKRVIRALEFYEQNARPISEHNEEQRAKESPYDFCYFVLNMDRAALYDRIEQRVDQMVKQGLKAEVERLRAMGYSRELVSMQGLGYKEYLDHLNGEISEEEAIYRIKRDTRHFAKRQLTWFRRERDVIWLDKHVCTTKEEEEAETRRLLDIIDRYVRPVIE
ncbi:MAG: tRNA (adenosine(37)-N6)-dimethylallyltransferase MiaA [Lachnospiraceae bacterium]|nr:tRNA (adenosine(37)-N6)-dimethylallyltransferase MiaA [Lachnospiraceae bacterium]